MTSFPASVHAPEGAPRTQGRFASALLAAAVLLGGGCTVPAERMAAPDAPTRALREQEMNARWQNHTLAELLAERGTPRNTMTIPGGGNPPGFISVYERDPVSGCVDAFALVYGPEPVIRNYYCR